MAKSAILRPTTMLCRPPMLTLQLSPLLKTPRELPLTELSLTELLLLRELSELTPSTRASTALATQTAASTSLRL